MNVLIGSSVLLIVGSGVALAIGWSGDKEGLVWASIAASIAAAVALGVAYMRTKSGKPAVTPQPTSGPDITAGLVPPAAAESSGAVTLRPSTAQSTPISASELDVTDEPAKPRSTAKPKPKPAASKAKPVAAKSPAAKPASAAAKPATAPASSSKTGARAQRSKARPATPATSKGNGKAAGTAAKPKTTRTAGEVVAIPDRKKFHRADCRFAKAKGAEKLTKAVARRRGYEACGICKP